MWGTVGAEGAGRGRDVVTVCPVAGLVTVERLASDDGGGAEDSSILDIAEASSFSFSSDNWERIDFIPLD